MTKRTDRSVPARPEREHGGVCAGRRRAAALLVGAAVLGACVSPDVRDESEWVDPPPRTHGPAPVEAMYPMQPDGLDAEGRRTLREELGAGPRERPAVITVAEAVREGLAYNRGVRIAQRLAAIEQTLADEARAGLIPRVDVQGSYRARDKAPEAVAPELGTNFTVGPKSTLAVDATVSFPLFGFGRYLYAYRAAQLGRQRAEAELEVTEADVAEAVTAAAFDLLETARQIDVARSNEEALDRQVADARSLLEAGRVTAEALLEAEVERDEARRLRERLEALLPVRRMVLNGLLGRPIDAPTELVDDPVTAEPTWSLDLVRQGALLRRPEWRASELAVRRAERLYQTAWGRELPELRGFVTYHNDDSDFSNPNDYFLLGVTLDVPVFTGGARAARIRRARHELQIALLERRELQAELLTEAADAYREVVQTYRDIGVAALSIQRAEESLRIQREKFAAGRATSQEVLLSTARLNDARFAHVQALYAYNVALRRLHRARGAEPHLEPRTGPGAEAAGAGEAGAGG